MTEAQHRALYTSNWERNMSINLQAQVTLSQLLLPSLMRRGEGRIVNVASTEGTHRASEPARGGGLYCLRI